MDFAFSPDDLAFRDEVRSFVRDNLSDKARRGQWLTPSSFTETSVSGSWHAALYKRGWVAPGWPKKYGGTGWSPVQRYIFETECGRAGAPSLIPMGLGMVAPVIMQFGTDEQKAFYLPRILSAEDYWCQGYSEPGAGSDLASLTTKAICDGDDYIVTGSKIWTTHAHFANRMFALVRTSDTPKPQDGISFLLINMDSKGITVRPIRTIGGDHEVNQVFFDDVRVPVRNRIGEENKGWTYAKYLLEFERGGGYRVPRLRHKLDRLRVLHERRHSKTPSLGDDSINLRLARIDIDLDALEIIQLKVLTDIQAGRNPGPVSSTLKLRGTTIGQAISRLGVDIIGPDSLVWESRRPLHAIDDDPVLPEDEIALAPAYLNGRASSIMGGTSEIQLEIIAKQVIGR